jgi:glycosyltransferase involved in cell wall biosynthesis
MKNLTLFFTYGVSLQDWEKNGSLDREIQIYSKLLDFFDKIYFITYGKNDTKLQSKLPKNIIVLSKKTNLPNPIYSLLIPLYHKKTLRTVDWLKTNQIMGSWSAVLTKILFRNKLNIRTGYTESLCLRKKTKLLLIKFIEQLAYRYADIATVTSKEQYDYINKKYSPKALFVIPNGIDTNKFKPKPRTKNKKTQLLFVGRLNEEKNIINLVKALRKIKNVKLTIIGKGILKEKILKLKKRYFLNIEIIDYIPNNRLPDIYNKADIYVQPSLYEGNPKTILEAMSCESPVVASNVAGIKNIITNRKTGLLCETTIDSISQKIKELIKNKKLGNTLSKKERIFIINNYDLNKIIKKEASLYLKINYNGK